MKNVRRTSFRFLALLLSLLILAPTLNAFAASDASPATALTGQDADFAARLDMTDEDYLGFKAMLYGEVMKQTHYIEISSYKLTKEQAQVAIEILSSNPDFFHLWGMSTGGGSSSYIQYLFVSYDMTEAERQEAVAAADKLLAGVEGNDKLTDVEKALILHDRIVLHAQYDTNYYPNGRPDENYTEYGILVQRTGVCQGYVEAYNYLLARCGIPSRTCTSRGMNHAWNIVTIDGEEYYVDCTWDDPSNGHIGNGRHDYFLISHEKLLSDDKHGTEDFEVITNSGKYDNAVWTSVDHSGFVLLDGELYCFDNSNSTLCHWADGTLEPLFTYSCSWASGTMWWVGNFSRLTTDGHALYFNLTDRIMRYVPGQGKPTEYLVPDTAEQTYQQIYAFEYYDGAFLLGFNKTPSNNSSTEYITYVPGAARNPIGIYLKSLPWATVFPVGGKFSTAGMELCVRYDDHSVEIAKNYTVSAVSTASTGKQTVTVTCAGFTVQYEIEVVNKSTGVTLTLDPNGGPGEKTIVFVTTPGYFNYPGAIAPRTGYDFVGWNTSKNATTGYSDTSSIRMSFGSSWAGDSYTFYSIWKRNATVFGDADGSGKVDAKDIAAMRRYFAGFDYETGTSSAIIDEGADADADNTVSIKDLGLLRRYFANYNYSTGTSTVVLGA